MSKDDLTFRDLKSCADLVLNVQDKITSAVTAFGSVFVYSNGSIGGRTSLDGLKMTYNDIHSQIN